MVFYLFSKIVLRTLLSSFPLQNKWSKSARYADETKHQKILSHFLHLFCHSFNYITCITLAYLLFYVCFCFSSCFTNVRQYSHSLFSMISYADSVYFLKRSNGCKWVIYKTRNTWIGNGMQEMKGTRGRFTRIPGNLLENSRKCSHFGIPGNIQEESRKCSRRFRGMLLKILGNVIKDSWECPKGFREMFKQISGNLNFVLFLEILLVFYQILLLNCYETMEKNNYWAILLKKTFSSLRLITILLSLITISLT